MSIDNESETEFSGSDGLLTYQTILDEDSRRVRDLEIENARLQRLVAELLIKNQQLRQLLHDRVPR